MSRAFQVQLEQLYRNALEHQVWGAIPHLVGPPGSGKSQAVRQLAKAHGVNVVTVNISSISPMEVRGTQVPSFTKDEPELFLLTAPYWTQLRDGDILFLDEFLSGFPQIYPTLLDILTSREVDGYKLPNIFIVGASNTTATPSKALTDRLIHIQMQPPRGSELTEIASLIIREAKLHPKLIESENWTNSLATRLEEYWRSEGSKGVSTRHLIASIQFGITGNELVLETLSENNAIALQNEELQYIRDYAAPDDNSGNTRFDYHQWYKVLLLLSELSTKELQKGINKMPDGHMKDKLQFILNKTGGDPQKDIEKEYEDEFLYPKTK